MIAHTLGFGGNGWKPALAQAPMTLPKAPPETPGTQETMATGTAPVTANMFAVVGLVAIAVVLIGTLIASESRD